ncbi:phage tail sheath subtilisin-like domain-containing protein [Azotobacter sp. CWF10]
MRVTSEAQADALFGAGSMLAGMVRAVLAQDTFTELQVMPVADNAEGVAATGALAFGAVATEAGTLHLMIAGRRVDVGVPSGGTPTSVATAVAAAINAAVDLPVTAIATTGTVTVTARHKGEAGNTLDLRVNYYDGQALPAGLTLTITALSGGTGNPDITDALAALGDEWFQVLGMPYTDAASLAALETELASRFGWGREIEMHAFAAARGTQGTLGTLGDSRNSRT